MKYQFRSLQSKVAVFWITLLVLVTAQSIYFASHELTMHRQDLERRGRVLASAVARMSGEPLLNAHITRMEEQLDSVLSEEDVLFARIVNDQYRVLADTRRFFQGWVFSGPITRTQESTFLGDVLLVRTPITVMGDTIGMVEMELSLERLHTRFQSNLLVLIAILLVEILLGLWLALFLERQIVLPLQTVAHDLGTEEIAQALAPLSVPQQSAREITTVVEAINDMRSRQIEHTRLELMGTVAASMAHEIRNPLEAINGSLEVIGSTIPAHQSRYLKIMREEIHNMDRYLAEFLSVSRPADLQLVPAPLSTVIADAVFLIHPLVSSKGCTVTEEYSDTRMCRIDASQMKRVIINIILNAIEAAHTGGTISIATSDRPDGVACTIRDDGRGISKDILPRLFEPYFTTKRSGSGIGLAVSRQIVEQHGGTIDITSRQGEWTLVTITLPTLVNDDKDTSSR